MLSAHDRARYAIWLADHGPEYSDKEARNLVDGTAGYGIGFEVFQQLLTGHPVPFRGGHIWLERSSNQIPEYPTWYFSGVHW